MVKILDSGPDGLKFNLLWESFLTSLCLNASSISGGDNNSIGKAPEKYIVIPVHSVDESGLYIVSHKATH